MPVLPKGLESQPPKVLQLFLVLNPINHQSLMQCGLVLPEESSRARQISMLLPPTGGEDLGSRLIWLCHFTLLCDPFFFTTWKWSVLQSSGLFQSYLYLL